MAMRFRSHQDAAQKASRRLMLMFVGVLLLLVLAVNGILALIFRLSLPWIDDFPRFFFETNTALVLLFVLGGCWFESMRLREGGPHVARLAGGQPIDPPAGQARDLYEKRLRNVVDEVAIAANLPPPAVFVLQREDAINAFAAGWDADDAVIVVTRGALERLTRDELQGVVAHEFSHILHGDMRLNMRLIGLVWGLQMIYNFGHSLAEPDEEGHRGVGLLFGLGLMGVGGLGWAAGRLLKAAVSRQREFLADASAVKFTRSIEGIGGALRKVADQAWRRQAQLRTSSAESLSHLFFVSSLRWAAFDAHPPLAERIRRLYGFEVAPLAARVLPPADDDAPETQPMLDEAAMLATSPGMVPSDIEHQPSVLDLMLDIDSLPAESWGAVVSPETTAALVVDLPLPDPPARVAEVAAPAALAPPAFDAPSPLMMERDALDRVGRWQGPGECRAAVLALLLTPGSQRELQAWQRETASLAGAASIYETLQHLTHAARLPVWELMLRRAARLPLAERRALAEASRRVMGADGQVSPLDKLRWLVLRHLLGGSPPVAPLPRADNDVAHLAGEISVVTAFLARIVEADEAAAAGLVEPVWYRAVMRVLLGKTPLLRWQAPDTDALVHAWVGLLRLSSMQRPLLVRAWVDAAVQLAPDGHLGPASADALRLATVLLNAPSPEELSSLYVELPQHA